jgi:hypothetical protein
VKYTVLGVYINDEPVVAAVLIGEQLPVDDTGPYEGDGQRWGTGVEAENAFEAEGLAVAQMNAANGVEPDESQAQ